MCVYIYIYIYIYIYNFIMRVITVRVKKHLYYLLKAQGSRVGGLRVLGLRGFRVLELQGLGFTASGLGAWLSKA